MEQLFLRSRWVTVSAVAIMIANWVWNISKGM